MNKITRKAMDSTKQTELWSLTTDESKPSSDFTFHDISYNVGKRNNVKRILQQMSGTFKSGQLTAILGPSGAGKTSLMNILAGLKTTGVEGRIEVDGVERNFKTFRKQSAYITQKDYLLKDLTIDEYMTSAAHLKLGNKVSDSEKKTRADLIIKTLGLASSVTTQISRLSGGERKRLSIGLELFDNPSFLFLDEPTSGLDSSSSLQCVALLRKIANSGRTVVATIHQPSSRLLDHFDHLYVVVGGSCMFQGPVEFLVPYLQTFNLHCPKYHNPADFVMDVASGEYGDVLPQLVSGIENGRLTYRGSLASSRSTRSINLEGNGSYQVNDDEGKKKNKRKRITYGAPFRTQVKVLLERTWRTMWREKMQTQTRFLTHIVFGIFIGLMYQTVGNDASYPFNAGLLAFSQLFIIFTGTMPTIVTFPMERNVLVREHLNHWYSLKAYYLAKLIVDIPFQILFPAIFLAIVYLMTGQPMCMMRFSMLLLVTICMSLVAQGIGLVFGAAFDIQTALFLSAVFAIPLLLFNGFCLRFNSIPFYLRWMSYGSLFRHGFEGAMLSVYDYDRPPLNCSQPYCYFRYPRKILETFDMDQSSYYVSIIGLMMYFVVMRIAGYFVLRFKLKSIS
ncbi:ATP-binding cassette sub-family G member 1 [Daphnia magna]|uniref:ATP-binding cassette sub-family G member 1 n=1 Tax=Daphnia magna TaxID=35525 RepID=UPI001402715A|nr:ATP-binding cassette sub-family G member 1 [Daphnia magna]XP_045029364.1 ATP-binding cassette sub-family G member 1 [Daphnia magna]XP_045029365.1 ATP-binding cassette sub-family G member 1 [Daphnia magna]